MYPTSMSKSTISQSTTVLENQTHLQTPTTNTNVQTSNQNPIQTSQSANQAPSLSIPTTVLQKPSPSTELHNKQIQIPTPQGGNNQIVIPVSQGENKQIVIPNEGNNKQIVIPNEGDGKEESKITAPWSRLNLKKLSEILDSTANRLLHNDLNGLLFIGVILKAANGITKALAEDKIDKQETGEAIFSRINRIVPNFLDKDRSFNWKDPNSGKDFHFVLSTEASKEGNKRFCRAYKENARGEDTEVFCISSVESQDKKFKSWRVEKNDFSREQIDSLTKASFPREKSKSQLSR